MIRGSDLKEDRSEAESKERHAVRSVPSKMSCNPDTAYELSSPALKQNIVYRTDLRTETGKPTMECDRRDAAKLLLAIAT